MNRSTCLLCVFMTVVVTAWSSSLHDYDLDEHIQRITRSDKIDGYELATFTAEDKTQTKRDLEHHVSSPSFAKRRFSLNLASGEVLRMSLERRQPLNLSVTRFVEHTHEGKRDIAYTPRDCFFFGPLERGEGHANLAMCGGKLMGSLVSAKRSYNVYSLPETTEKRSANGDRRLLVTWQDNKARYEELKRDLTDGIEIPEEDKEPESAEQTENMVKRESNSVTVEIGNYLDRYYIEDVGKNLGITTNQRLIDLQLTKWAGVSNILMENRRWDIILKIVVIEIMRSDPSWYTSTSTDKIGTRKNLICEGTRNDVDYDQITLHTSQLSTPRPYGASWLGGVCRRRYRCSVSTAVNTDFATELHELGHSLGLNHDNCMPACDVASDKKGFMGGNKNHFRPCYNAAALIATFTNPGKSCLHSDQYTSYVATYG